MKKIKTCLIPAAVLSAALCALVLFSARFSAYRVPVACGAAGVSILVLFACRGVERSREIKRRQQMDDVFAENTGLRSSLIDRVAIPCALVEESGRIVWENESLKKVYDGRDVKQVQPNFSFHAPLVAAPMELSSRQPP